MKLINMFNGVYGRWQDLVNAKRKFGFRQTRGISWLTQNISRFQEGICALDLFRKLDFYKNKFLLYW